MLRLTEKFILKDIDTKDLTDLDVYESTGGYGNLKVSFTMSSSNIQSFNP